MTPCLANARLTRPREWPIARSNTPCPVKALLQCTALAHSQSCSTPT